MKINYVAEINAFERWLETNYLPPLSQLLWYKLFALFNKCGWAEWVTVDNQRLMALIGIKREGTFIELRDNLVDAGLLCYKKGKKGYPNKYNLLYLTCQCEVNTEVETVVESEVESEVETVVNTEVYTVDINKLNQTKQKNKSMPKAQTNFSDDSKEINLANYMFSKIKGNCPTSKEPNFQKWAKTFNIMLNKDNHGYDDIKEMISFVAWDKFWKSNILCPNKLKDKWDTLYIQREQKRKE